jgi:uncharacterized repeat protein (TIGR04076 family)
MPAGQAAEDKRMKQYEVEVERVTGHYSHSYRPGVTLIFNGLDTPDGFCGGGYTTLFPILVALGAGGRFGYEADPLCKAGMACPDNGNVVFKVRLLSGK